MPGPASLVSVLVVGALVAMARGWLAPELALAGVLGICVLCGVATPSVALGGFASESLHTVGLLLIVSAAVHRSGALSLVQQRLATSRRSQTRAQCQVVFPTMLLSAFLNNTAVVALLLPVVRNYARQVGLSPSKLLIPLSYAAILGGVCTLIGTSTNLVVRGALPADLAARFGMFDISLVGVPVALVGGLALLGVSRWLLPDRSTTDELFADPRTFTVQFLVEPNGSFAGRPLSELQRHPSVGLQPVEIWREGALIVAPTGDDLLRANDRLVFAGPARLAVSLHRVRGLSAATASTHDATPGTRRRFVEVIVTSRCPLVGYPVGDGSFRRRYDAAVIAVARHGQPLGAKGVGDWALEVGDILLVEAAPRLDTALEHGGELIVVAGHADDASTPRSSHPALAIAITATMVLLAASNTVSMFVAVIGAVAAMLACRVLDWSEALDALDGRLLLTIAFALSVGALLEHSGAAVELTAWVIGLGLTDPWWMLVVLYVVTALITEVITNNAAAVIMIPLALASASTLGVDPMAMIVTVTIAASTSFLTPIGYQTNLMVYGPGGYRFSDFVRAGIPLNIIVGIVTVELAPRWWPF